MNYMGELPPTVGRDKSYFEQRFIELDCRGMLVIHAESHWGFFVKVITQSHDIANGVEPGISAKPVDRPVIVEKGAWIGSGTLLYNCIIGEGAIVAVGTVVRSCEVKPYTMIAGNPARVIARWNGETWDYFDNKWTVLE